jgi:hypothetical protein
MRAIELSKSIILRSIQAKYSGLLPFVGNDLKSCIVDSEILSHISGKDYTPDHTAVSVIDFSDTLRKELYSVVLSEK